MNHFISALYHDLHLRVRRLYEDLDQRDIHSGISDEFVESTMRDLLALKEDIEYRIESGDLELDILRRDNLARFSSYQQRFELIESYPYQVILKFGAPEVYLNKKISLIYDEIRCLLPVPVVTTISNFENYYWAYPYYNIIAVPLGEERSLLNLPDLYHEIAHLIFGQYYHEFTNPFFKKLAAYIALEKRIATEEDKGDQILKLLASIQRSWTEFWVEEFICDLIATYLTGASYGWSNLKITSLRFGIKDISIYTPFPQHPSNEARMRAIFLMLKKLSLDTDLADLTQNWETFITITDNQKPGEYDYYFPDELLALLTDLVYKTCNDSDLASYVEQYNSGTETIAVKLNKAWEMIRTKPQGYSAWEANIIDEISERNL